MDRIVYPNFHLLIHFLFESADETTTGKLSQLNVLVSTVQELQSIRGQLATEQSRSFKLEVYAVQSTFTWSFSWRLYLFVLLLLLFLLKNK